MCAASVYRVPEGSVKTARPRGRRTSESVGVLSGCLSAVRSEAGQRQEVRVEEEELRVRENRIQ